MGRGHLAAIWGGSRPTLIKSVGGVTLTARVGEGGASRDVE